MRSIHGLTRMAALAALLSLLPTLASAQQAVRIAQGFPSLSFLPVWGARALNTFAAEGLTAVGGLARRRSGGARRAGLR